jgi:RNA polymerase sigma-70 factor (ECF subfamily)
MDVSRTGIFNNAVKLDERAFEALFFEHYDAVYGVLFRLTGDPHEADDLTAETFWRLWSRPPSRDENVAGWLYRVATNLGYNALRASKRRRFHEQEEGEAPGELLGSAAPGSAADPARQAELREDRERVRAVLRQMPLRDVQILLLRYAGLAYKEIAAAAGVAPGSVGTLLARAEARFADLFRKGDTDAPER